MRKAIVFGIEAILALLFAASLVYAVINFGSTPGRMGFGTWSSKLVAEDVAAGLAQRGVDGEQPGVRQLLEKIRGTYWQCIRASGGGEAHEINCAAEGGNRVAAQRIFFDGEKFSKITVEVSYP